MARTRSQQFGDLVLDAVERLEGQWARQLEPVDFAVEEVPPPIASVFGGIPLGRACPATRSERARVTVYRRPTEARAGTRDELAALVHDVVVEQVAELFERAPEEIDPGYGDEA